LHLISILKRKHNMAMSTGGKVAVTLGVLTGVGVGLYFLLRPTKALAATNPLAAAQAKALAAQKAAAAYAVAAKSSGSSEDAKKAALAASVAKGLADAAKNMKIGGGGGSGSGPSGGGPTGGGDKKGKAPAKSGSSGKSSITQKQINESADAYYCNYNPEAAECGGQGLPSDLCQNYPDAPECQALAEASDSFDSDYYCSLYPDACYNTDGGTEYYCSLYPDACNYGDQNYSDQNYNYDNYDQNYNYDNYNYDNYNYNNYDYNYSYDNYDYSAYSGGGYSYDYNY
jgi:hypothetical protein